ncbi:MAG: transcription antitermination factor NusB [Deltaproteobacteria bacterium]|nr:transcription antitermination factor NusB [Deltaproteobacteria bacterium]
MGRRRRARELAVQVLFHMEFNPDNADEAFDLVCRNFASLESSKVFSKELVLGVSENKEELDKMISRSSRNWRMERMPLLDRCILRLAVFEILLRDDIPPKVSIDESVELGKKFGGEDSSSFINGVLDNVYNTLVREGRLSSKGE